jgi:hypothetical protein
MEGIAIHEVAVQPLGEKCADGALPTAADPHDD